MGDRASGEHIDRDFVMRGSVIKRGKSWTVVIELAADPETGKRRQRWHSGYRTRKEAERARVNLLGKLDTGTYVEKSRQPLSEFIEEWFPTIEDKVRPATLYSYERNLHLHVIPYIGSMPMQSIDGGTLDGLYAELRKSGSRHHRGGGLSGRSVRYVHTILHRVFRDAVKRGRLLRNPADAAEPPRRSEDNTPEIVTWSGEELGQFLEGVAEHRYSTALCLLATSGMRRGEALGLRWKDLDLDKQRLARIRQTVITVNHAVQFGRPKTEKGERDIALDAETVARLRAHRQRQSETRLMMGPAWHDLNLVFCRDDGEPLNPERFSRDFDKAVEALGLPRIRLHDLRHTWATLALESGIAPKVVQERLGHASIAITLDLYSHVSIELQREAAEKVAARIRGGA